MRRATNPPRRRVLSRLAVALACVGAVTLTGLPGMDYAAEAAVGKRCDQRFLNKTVDRTPPNSGVPGNEPYQTRPDPEDAYDFNNPAKAFDGLLEPTPGQLAKAGDTDADIRKWERKYAASGNAGDKAMAIYARYSKQLGSPRPITDWGRWLDLKYIGNEVNNRKGNAFEGKIVRDFKLVGPDWICGYEVKVKDPATGKIHTRVYDAYNPKTKQFVEFKSNGAHRPEQLRVDRLVTRDPQYADHKLRLVTGAKTEQKTINEFRRLNQELGGNRALIYEQKSNGSPRFTANNYTRYDQVMNPDPRKGGRGPMNDAALRSAPTPEDARRLQEQYRRADTRGGFGRGPGGVDFTTLELSFVGNPVKGRGLDYAFKADYVPDPDANPGWGGKDRLQLASDSFFTWLALTPDKFWVNLNPDQPDKIMDSQFGKTDAGRVLLEADLAMKYDFAEAINPEKHSNAKTFWDTAPRRDGMPCFPRVRMWIEPKPAKVREQDGGIYILDAPMRVDTEWMETDWQNPGAQTCDLTTAEEKFSEESLRQLVIPEVEKRVNSYPEYADLRRVYSSRVAAEWVRQQDAKKPTDFRKIINSNDVSRWPLRGENAEWDKVEVWQRYMKTLREGIEWFKMEYGGKVYNWSVGGVDFSKSPKRNITKVEFDVQHPRMDKTTKSSIRTEVSYRDSETAYLGGNGAGKIDNGGGTDPTPTPTPTPDPSTPPSPSPNPPPTKPGGGHDNQAPPANNAGGDLATTGSPVGWIAALAGALLAAGSGMLWWTRRRRALRS